MTPDEARLSAAGRHRPAAAAAAKVQEALSLLDEKELGLLLQLVAARPEAAAGLRHLGTCTRLLGRQFDAGALTSGVPARMCACCRTDKPQLPVICR